MDIMQAYAFLQITDHYLMNTIHILVENFKHIIEVRSRHSYYNRSVVQEKSIYNICSFIDQTKTFLNKVW